VIVIKQKLSDFWALSVWILSERCDSLLGCNQLNRV
jgi:hypothetical protein